MGNRPNEGYAEMTVCLYLPDGRVGFMFKRPHIEGHTSRTMPAGCSSTWSRRTRSTTSPTTATCASSPTRARWRNPAPRSANPHEPCTIDLKVTAVADPSGGEPEWDEGEEPPRRHVARVRDAVTPSSRWPSSGACRSATNASISTPGSGSGITRGARVSGRASGGTGGSPPASVRSASRARCAASATSSTAT